MDGEILAAGTDVEPFPGIKDQSPDLSALADPFRENGNVGNVPAWRDPIEDRARPDANACEIVAAGMPIAIGHIDDAVSLQRHVLAVIGLAQDQRHIVSRPGMFVEQRLEIDISQNVAAISNEQLLVEERLDVFDSTAGPENFRLVDELHGMAAVLAVREKFLKRRRPMMRVNDKRFHARRDEMIERERNQRFLENRYERLGQIFGERTQAHAEPGAKDEGFRDHRSAVLVLRGRFAKTARMAEETIWRGTASQLKNLGCFILCFLFCWLIVPIFIGFRRYLETKNKVFELTNERLKMTEGIFSKITETLELYRVKDIEVLQPFIYRIVGLENIKVNTSDLSSPVILLDGISQKIGFADKLRNQVEIIRAQKKVRELDIE